MKSTRKIKRTAQNLLINADNLEALKALFPAYEKRVDVIYIDPPYNTQNHKFLYKDNFVKANQSQHVKWVEFMKKRLSLVCGLLREDGVLFISIDENEVAHLKLLCDAIFGEENYITQLVWQKKNKPSFLHKKISSMFEFVLCYAKDINKAPMLSIERTTESKPYPLNFKNNPLSTWSFEAQKVHFKLKDTVIKASDMSSKNIASVLLDDVMIKNGVNKNVFKMQGSWRYTQKFLDALMQKGCELRVAQLPFRINYIKKETKQKQMRNLLTKDSYNMQTYEDGIAQIIELFGFEAFTKPKPVGLVKTLLKSVLHSKNEALILDFFAGSATTAHAMMELNKEEGKALKYILVQSSETLKKNSTVYKNGYKNIYEITKERVKRVAQRYNLESFEEIR